MVKYVKIDFHGGFIMALSGLFNKNNNNKKSDKELGKEEFDLGITCLKANDISNALKHLTNASKLGNINALAQVAIIGTGLFRETHDVTYRDDAIHMAHLAVMKGVPAVNILPDVYLAIAKAYEEKGETEEAISYYEDSALYGSCDAAVKLALIYAANSETIELADKWYQEAVDLGCDMAQSLEIAKLILKAKRKIPLVTLNEEFVNNAFKTCFAKDDSPEIIEVSLYQKDYGFQEDSSPIKFDRFKISEMKPQLEYTLGQLKDLHENYPSITVATIQDRYDDVEWTNNPTLKTAYLLLLLAARLVGPVEFDTGELPLKKDTIPTLLPTDPRYEKWLKENEKQLLCDYFGSEE